MDGREEIRVDGPWATSTPSRSRAAHTGSYEARLARRVLFGGVNASPAAMALLESCEPRTLEEAIGLLTRHGELTVEAFDRIADAWSVFRHVGHLSWD